MISLDKKILDEKSAVARRMVEYGAIDQLYILIPSKQKKVGRYGNGVYVESTGGNKLFQFFRLLYRGKALCAREKVEGITVQDPFFTAFVGLYIKRACGTPLEIQVHGDFYGSEYYKKSGIMNRVRYALGKMTLPRADSVRVVGERVRQSLSLLGLDPHRISVQPIDTVKMISAYNRASDQDVLHPAYPNFEKIFVWAGRMEPVKNLLFLIDVFSDVVKERSRWGLLLVGEGTQKETLIREVKKRAVEKNILFLPWHDTAFVYMKHADCVLFPSLSEGYGLVPMEAAQAGTPVIMTDVGVANYELPPSDRVRIVPVGDRDAFIRAMLDLDT